MNFYQPFRTTLCANGCLSVSSDEECGLQLEMRCFFSNSPAMLCIAGTDGHFKRLSAAWSDTLGWPPEQMKSKPLHEFIHPDDRSATASELGRLADRVPGVVFENRCLCQDGSYKWLEWTANRLCPQGLVFAIVRDITRRRQLEQRILEACDQEKSRLGRELHDGLCQNLAGIAALGTALSRRLAESSDPAAGDAREITRLLNETIGQVRDMARGLNPVNLERIGLAAALEIFAANVESLFHVKCTFSADPRFPQLKPEAGIHLYRIAQEAVNNALIHGGGGRIEILLGFQGGCGLLRVLDDGSGMPEIAQSERMGIGLHTMDYRSRFIGGTLHTGRRSPHGTRIDCLFPVPTHPDAG